MKITDGLIRLSDCSVPPDTGRTDFHRVTSRQELDHSSYYCYAEEEGEVTQNPDKRGMTSGFYTVLVKLQFCQEVCCCFHDGSKSDSSFEEAKPFSHLWRSAMQLSNGW